MKIIENHSDQETKKKSEPFLLFIQSFKQRFARLWSKSAMIAEPEFSPVKRLMFLSAILFFAWGVVATRLVGIYFGEAKVMQNHLAKQQTATETIRPRPGDILDREGRLLATSVDTQSLFVVPRKIKNVSQFSKSLASIIGTSPEALQTKIEQHHKKGFLWIDRRLTPDVVLAIRELKFDKSIYGFRREYRRYYPNGSLGIHVLGLRDIDGKGHGGIEQAYEKKLAGEPGKRVLVRDAHNRIIHLYEDPKHPVVQGKSIQLTIDLHMQQTLEQELDQVMKTWQPRGCCAILCDPKSGEVLGMSSRPSFNPEDPTTFHDMAWINRALAWSYEPGSTIKPLIVASAIQQQVISKESGFHGHWGEYRMGKRLLHDTHAYGEMSLADVLIKSSNIGMAQIGEQMTNAGLYEALQRFGFGLRTGSGLPGELAGNVRPLSQWNQYSTGSIPMGQELSVTPLQMIAAHSVLASGGAYQQPRFVLKVDHKDPQSIVPGLQMRLMDPEVCQWIIRDPMRRVMMEGTGKRVHQKELDLFGKTGTSQLYDPEMGQYSKTKTVCSFVCGIPAENPKLLVLVAVDQPTLGQSHYGGTVAGPAAVAILKKTYRRQKRLFTKSPVNTFKK